MLKSSQSPSASTNLPLPPAACGFMENSFLLSTELTYYRTTNERWCTARVPYAQLFQQKSGCGFSSLNRIGELMKTEIEVDTNNRKHMRLWRKTINCRERFTWVRPQYMSSRLLCFKCFNLNLDINYDYVFSLPLSTDGVTEESWLVAN